MEDLQKMYNVDGNFRNQVYVTEFSVSQGECVAKALLKVWGRVQKLHRQQQLTETILNKETAATQTDQQRSENETRCKLLELQLRYIRKVVHDTHNSSSSTKSSFNHRKVLPPADPKSLEVKVQLNGNQRSEDEIPNTEERKIICNSKLNSSQTIPKFRARDLETERKCPNQLPSKEASNHYHLKLDDIPFILGTSTGASHSVIANVQNLISMMKSHNKGLCSSAVPANKYCKLNKPAGKCQKMDNEHHLKLTKEELNVILQTLENELEILKRKESTPLRGNPGENNAEGIAENKISHLSHICSLLNKITPYLQKETDLNNILQKTAKSTAVARNKERIMQSRKFLHEVQRAKHLLQEDICWTDVQK